MKIKCVSCSQPIEVNDDADLDGVRCPSCNSALVQPANPPVTFASKRPSSLLEKFSFVCSIVSILLAVYCIYRVQNFKWGGGDTITSSDPIATVKNYYHDLHRGDNFTAEGAFWNANTKEINKTLEIVSTNMQADYVLALVRFSVSDKVFRKGLWLKKFNGTWYMEPYIDTYDPAPEVAKHLDWFKDAKDKESAWEKESATP